MTSKETEGATSFLEHSRKTMSAEFENLERELRSLLDKAERNIRFLSGATGGLH